MSSPVTVSFINHGATLLVEYSDGRKVEMFKPYTITTDEEQKSIGVRNNIYSVQTLYENVTTPDTSTIEELREVLESYLSSPAWEQSFSLSLENTDIAGQVATSTPTPLGDYRFTYNLNERNFSQLVNGGTITHDTTDRAALLSVASNGQYAVISTFSNHPYFAGYPIDVEFTTIDFHPQTGVEKEVFYGDRTASAFTGCDGIKFVARSGTHYLEFWKSGTKHFEVARADWYDPMDGTGPSALNFGTFSAFCVFDIQWLWLGGAGVGLFAYANGHKYLVHAQSWSFFQSTIIISNPQKPLQAAIISTGGSGSFKFICSTVKTLGNPSLEVGEERSIYTNSTGVALPATGTICPLIGLRLRSAFKNGVIDPVHISMVCEGANDVVRWYLIMNPQTIGGGAFTYGNSYGGYLASDCFEVALGVAANTLTIGTGSVIRAEELTGSSRSSSPTKTPRKIGWSLSGTAETLVLAAERLAAATTVNASISIRQRY